jgi:hypothetical protein
LPEPPTTATIVQVVADGLQLRSAAGTDAPVVGGLERGAVARIESEPVESDGFVWYEVVDLDSNRGWVASGDDEDTWLAALTDEPDGQIVLRFESFGHVFGPVSLPSVTVMDDGRVVMADASGGWRLWRMTDVGFDRLSEAVLKSPYLQASAEYDPVLRAGLTEGPPHGQGSYRFTLGTAAEPVVVRSVQWFGEEEEAAFYEPAPERRALDGIAHGLNTLDDALGPNAWEAESFPYIAASFLIAVDPVPGSPGPLAVRVDPSTLPAGTPLGDLGDLPPGRVCGDLTVEEAFELARLLRDAGAELALDIASGASITTDAGWLSVSVWPQAPDGYPGCADAGL